MTKNLTAIALEKGYQIIKTPKCILLPIIGYIWLPIWLTWEPEFLSKKHCRYTLEGFIFKLKRKQDRKRLKKQIKLNRERLAKQFQTV